MEEPFDKRRDRQQSGTYQRSPCAGLDEQRPGRYSRHLAVCGWRYGAPDSHLQGVGRRLEHKRDPGQGREGTKKGRARRSCYEHQEGETPQVDRQGQTGDGPAPPFVPMPPFMTGREWLSVACHRFVPGGQRSRDSLGLG